METITGILKKAAWTDGFIWETESCLNDRISTLGMGGGATLTRVLPHTTRIEYPNGTRTKRLFIVGVVLWNPEHAGGVPGLFCCNGRLARRIQSLNHHGKVPTFKLYYDHDRRKWEISGANDMRDRLARLPHAKEYLSKEKAKLVQRAHEEAAQYRPGA